MNAQLSDNGLQFRVILTNSQGSATSSPPAELSVTVAKNVALGGDGATAW